MDFMARDEFLELAAANPWAARAVFTEAYHAHKGDRDAQKKIIDSAVEAVPCMARDRGAHATFIVDIAHFCMNNLPHAIDNGQEAIASSLISIVQKVTRENAELTARYRGYLLDTFRHIHQAMPDLAHKMRLHQLAMMCADDASARATFAATDAILFPAGQRPPARPVRTGRPLLTAKR